jgi:hypothetical protein
MLIRFKEGTFLKFVDHSFLHLAKIFFEEFQKDDVVPVVTSACDGRHMAKSLHYEGLGWDWRIWGLKDPGATADRIRIRARELNPRYDIVFGDPAHLDHIHSEFDIKKGG